MNSVGCREKAMRELDTVKSPDFHKVENFAECKCDFLRGRDSAVHDWPNPILNGTRTATPGSCALPRAGKRRRLRCGPHLLQTFLIPVCNRMPCLKIPELQDALPQGPGASAAPMCCRLPWRRPSPRNRTRLVSQILKAPIHPPTGSVAGSAASAAAVGARRRRHLSDLKQPQQTARHCRIPRPPSSPEDVRCGGLRTPTNEVDPIRLRVSAKGAPSLEPPTHLAPEGV